MTGIDTEQRGTMIRVNGVALHVEECGAGATILGLHGTGSSAAFWADAADDLARHGRAITYDRRGSGRSERPDPYATSVHEHADDAAALLAALDAAPAIVIGRSWGGEIAVDLALRYPDSVRALALLEGGGLSLGDEAQRYFAQTDERLYAAAKRDMDTVGETMVRLIVGDHAWDAMPEPAKELFTANGPAIIAEHRAGLLNVTPDELRSIGQPTLLVAGRDSPAAFAETTELLAAALQPTRLEWVEGSHLIDPAHPVVRAFVDEVIAASRRGA